jgi:hypothetical protein
MPKLWKIPGTGIYNNLLLGVGDMDQKSNITKYH